MLGSSGECLPVNRITAKRQLFAKSSTTNRTDSNSTYSSCNSSDGNDDVGEEKYYSAKTSFDDFVEGEFHSVVIHIINEQFIEINGFILTLINIV